MYSSTFLFVLWLFVNSAAQAFHVTIDPGHGGKDHGAISGQVRESELTLMISQKLATRLTQNPQFQVSLTRTTDISVPLSSRAQFAQEQKADVLLSIHVNSSADTNARGAEFYFQNMLPPDEESMLLANRENQHLWGDQDKTAKQYPLLRAQANLTPEVTSILHDLLDSHRIFRSSRLAKSLKEHWQGSRKHKRNSILQAPFFLLSFVTVPSTLVELGFLTNKEDFDLLTNPTYQDRVVQSLYEGLLNYKESVDKSAR